METPEINEDVRICGPDLEVHIDEHIQACGTFDVLTDEYTLTVASGALVVTFDFLKKKDIEHLLSCLSCMIASEEQPNEQ